MAIKDVARELLSFSLVTEPAIQAEDTRVYNVNRSALGSWISRRYDTFVNGPITKPFREAIARGNEPSEDDAAYVLASFASFLSDAMGKITEEQRARLAQGKVLIPLGHRYLSLNDNRDLLQTFGKYVEKAASQYVPAAGANAKYKDFARLVGEEVTNAKEAEARRTAKKAERDAAISQGQQPPAPPPAQYTPAEAEAESRALTQDSSVEEMVVEVESKWIIRPFFKKYGWWILGGVVAIFVGTALWKRHKARRQ